MNAVSKRSISIRGHRTSFSIEQPFYDELAAIAASRNIPFAQLIAEIDDMRSKDTNLSSAVRLFVLASVKRRVAD